MIGEEVEVAPEAGSSKSGSCREDNSQRHLVLLSIVSWKRSIGSRFRLKAPRKRDQLHSSILILPHSSITLSITHTQTKVSKHLHPP